MFMIQIDTTKNKITVFAVKTVILKTFWSVTSATF